MSLSWWSWRIWPGASQVGEKLAKSWWIWWSWWNVGEKLVLVIFVKSLWSSWKVGEFGRGLVKLWWKVGQVGKELVKSWASWWKVGEKLVKLVNLVGGWWSWSEVGQVGEKLFKLVNLVTLRSGLSTAGDETVKWENCLRTHDTSSTPDTSVQRWARHHIVFDHHRMVK